MWILLAITLFLANDNVDTKYVRTLPTSDKCNEAKELLQQGTSAQVVNTVFVCVRKPK